MQQGSKGAMRDLDYINPRPPKAPSALPPDIRRKLGLDRGPRARSESPAPSSMVAVPENYIGACNAAPKKGLSGAGTDWVNPNGHAFIRRRSGVAMSQRASRHAQMTGASKDLIANQSRASSGDRSNLAPGAIRRAVSRERSAMSRDCESPVENVSCAPSEGGYSSGKPPRAF